MNTDLLQNVSATFRGRKFPPNVAFNLCYFNKHFDKGDLMVDRVGIVIDPNMQAGEETEPFTVNGVEVKDREWCGTVCCVAGMTVLIAQMEHPELVDERNLPTSMQAQILLGLDDKQAEDLFTPDPTICRRDWGTITPEEVADVIDAGIATGSFNWLGLK